MENVSQKNTYWATFFIALITIASYFGNTYFTSSITSFFQIVFGSIFILFLPGYYLTINFFGKNEIDILERFALSFALSISVIPLFSFYLNLAGAPIHFYSIFAIVLSIILGSIIYQRFLQSKKGNKI